MAHEIKSKSEYIPGPGCYAVDHGMGVHASKKAMEAKGGNTVFGSNGARTGWDRTITAPYTSRWQYQTPGKQLS